MIRRRLVTVAAGVVLVVLSAGCSSGGKASDAQPSGLVVTSQPPQVIPIVPRPTAVPSPSVSAGPTAPSGASPFPAAVPADGYNPVPGLVDPAALPVAAAYLAARENAVSFTHPTPTSWLNEVRTIMTPAGLARLTKMGGGTTPLFGFATAHDRRWSVATQVACEENVDPGHATATRVTLSCAVTDRTVDGTGTPVIVGALPVSWPYNGLQISAVLLLVKSGGKWLVEADQTGQAG